MRIPSGPRFLRLRTSASGQIPQIVYNYLLPHEHEVITVRRHPGAFLSHLFLLGCCCVTACLITALTNSGPIVLSVAWAVFLAVAVWLVIRVTEWSYSYFVATEVRLIFITGLVKPKAISVPLREIVRLETHRSPIGRLAGYGEFIAVPVRPGYAIPKMNYMPYLEQLLTEIQNLFHHELAGD